MSYFKLEEEEAAIATAGYGGQSSVPAGVDDIETTASFQNFVHLSSKSQLITNFNVDTDLAPVLGRFSNDEEAREAKNVLLRAQFMNVLVRLKGSKPVSIEVHGMSYHRRVVRIMRASRSTITHFSIEIHSQGANAIIAVPDSFYGSVLGPVRLSPTFSNRASLVVQDEEDPNKTRYSVAPLPGVELDPDNPGETPSHSAVTHIIDEKRRGAIPGGKPYLCTLEEYAVEFSDAVEREGDFMVRYEHSFWPVRFGVYVKRLFTYGSRAEKTAFILAVFGMSLAALPFLIILWAIFFAFD